MEPLHAGVTPGESWYVVEDRVDFSRSLLWRLQRHYYAGSGIAGWRDGVLPYYVTSNPTIANAYAEIVLGLWRDTTGAEQGQEPLYVVELGAGPGLFAFYFLRRLVELCEQAGVTPAAFRYILTDIAPENVHFWEQHPRLRPFAERGLLDTALFDIDAAAEIGLRGSGQLLSAGSLRHPLVVIANYVFDSVPQDLLYVDQGQVSRCLLSSVVDADPAGLAIPELLARLRYRFDYEPVAAPAYPEPALQRLLADYQETLGDSHLLFPAAALRALQRLQALSLRGLVMLTADKGEHRLEGWQGMPPPALVVHGSFSLDVNYHAFAAFCEQSGGQALVVPRRYSSINVLCLRMLPDTRTSVETRRAYRRCVQDFGPDDYYHIVHHARQSAGAMDVEAILAHVRFSLYDSYQLAAYLPRLIELAPDLDPEQRAAVVEATDRAWEMYFPLGEALDLAEQIGLLLYNLEDYARALVYFQRSIDLYGAHAGTLYNLAACQFMLDEHAAAEENLRVVLEHDPENRPARDLLAACR